MSDLSTQLAPQNASFATMMFDPSAMRALTDFGKMMSESRVTIPAHLVGKPADCTAVALQALQWGFNPYAVAQKTHVTQGGALGYEAQLVNAAVIASGKLKAAPDYEFIGDWSKILGKVEERKSDKGGKYYVAVWDKRDEAGLGVICRAQLANESKPREITVMLAQAWPRFSTQWATDPQQQITYLAVRKFARRYTPDVILGVYTGDELEGPQTIDMGVADEIPPPPPAGPQRKSATAPAPSAPTPAPAQCTVIDVDAGEVEPPSPAAAPSSKPPTPAASAPAGASISAGQAAYLRNKLKAAGIEEVVICARFQVSGIEMLSAEQFDEIKSELLAMS